MDLSLRKGPGRGKDEMNDGAGASQQIDHRKAFPRLVHPAIGVVGAQAEWRDVPQGVHQFGDERDGTPAPIEARLMAVTVFQRFQH